MILSGCKKEKNRYKTVFFNKPAIFYFLMVSIIVYIVVLLVMEVPYGHDIEFHVNRVRWIADGLHAGDFPVRIYHNAMNGMGYASPLFYGDVFLYIPAILHLCGVPLGVSYKLFMILCVVSITVSMYYSAKCIFKNKTKAYYTTFFYIFSSYVTIDLLDRQALGEFQAFIFLPLVLLGIYSIINDDKKKWILLPIGLAGILLSHLITAVLCVVFLAIYFICNIKKVKEDSKIIKLLLASVGIFFLLTAAFILPMLEQMAAGEFYVTAGILRLDIRDRGIPFLKFITGKLSDAQRTYWWPTAAIVSCFMLLIVFTILYYKNKEQRNKTIFIFLIFAWSAYLLATDIFPWQWEALQNYVYFIQFPWRLLTFTSLFLAFVGGNVVIYSPKKKTDRRKRFLQSAIVLALCITGTAFVTTLSYKVSDLVPGGVENMSTKHILGRREYLPSGANYKGLIGIGKRDDPIETNFPVDYTFERPYGKVIMTFEHNENNLYIYAPLIYYKGYTANIELPDGQIKKLKVSSTKGGRVRVHVGNFESGKITVWYHGTKIQKISFCISVGSVLLLLLYIFRNYLVRKRKEKL